MRRLVPFLAILLLPLSTAAAGPRGNQQQLAGIEKAVQSIRGLQQIRPVKASFPTNDAFNRALDTEEHALAPDREIAISQAEYVMLGLLNKTDDLNKIIFGVTPNSVLGFYSYLHRTLYVRNDANQAFGPMRFTIAHEFTHVLQDQHYNLRSLLPDQNALAYRNTDLVSAHHAVTEGDADLVQNIFVNRTYSAADRRALAVIEAQPVKGPSLPKAMKAQLYFPYTYGDSFVRRFYMQGGMNAVNALYRRLPKSTYEILHPDAYQARWKPATVTLHTAQGFADWSRTDDDVWGAFGYRLVLMQFLNQKTADRVVSGYRGDRYIFLQKADAGAILLKSVWVSSKAATAARGAFIAMIRARYRNAVVAVHGDLVTDPEGAVLVKRTGSRLTVAFGASADVAQRLGTAATS